MTNHATLWRLVAQAMSDGKDWDVSSLSEYIKGSGYLDSEDDQPCAPGDERPKWTRNLRNVLHSQTEAGRVVYLARNLYRMNQTSGPPVLKCREDEAEDQLFAAEADFRDFLANNLGCVEPGLRLYQQGEQNSVEYHVEGGRIDILAVDKAGRFVVFELKLGRGRNKALGQLLYYMGWVDANLGKAPCRGIIVAKEITDDLVLAVKRVQGVSLYRYKLSVAVEQVS